MDKDLHPGWAVASAFGSIFGMGIGWDSLLAGDRPLALACGALGIASSVVLSGQLRDKPIREPKGEIATMSEPDFERLVLSVQQQAASTGAADAPAIAATSRPLPQDDGFEQPHPRRARRPPPVPADRARAQRRRRDRRQRRRTRR